jgi:hypothetical protein
VSEHGHVTNKELFIDLIIIIIDFFIYLIADSTACHGDTTKRNKQDQYKNKAWTNKLKKETSIAINFS